MGRERTIAYFSMEVGLHPDIQTYSGGLGVLAGDTIRAGADLRVPLVAVTLLNRRGYLRQKLDANGWQTEEPATWPVERLLRELPQRVSVTVEGRTVQIRAWEYVEKGTTGGSVPVLFLDTQVPANSEWDRGLTDSLYGGDDHYRLCQEVVLGIGGVRMLEALGYDRIDRYHMNEGHAALLGLELPERERRPGDPGKVTEGAIESVRSRCVFTTHTPVPSGHDQFPIELARRVLGPRALFEDDRLFCCEGRLNMTYLALNLSGYVNGVAKRHAEVSRLMFGHYTVDAITNGVHVATWASPPFQRLFDRYIPDWRADSLSLRYAHGLPAGEVWAAHVEAKAALLNHVGNASGVSMDPDVLTVGFARRATAYKRPDLLFHDVGRLNRIAETVGPLQLIFAGKAHPRDVEGKQLIRRIFEARGRLGGRIKFAYLPDYDMGQAKLMTAGVDVWLNTPQPPMEASGTSGMKAALNGVPSLSVLDGWWVEGHIEGVTGWSIGRDGTARGEAHDRGRDADLLYTKLEQAVLPAYLQREQFQNLMVHCISLNGSFFNTHRMMQQYVVKAYLA